MYREIGENSVAEGLFPENTSGACRYVFHFFFILPRRHLSHSCAACLLLLSLVQLLRRFFDPVADDGAKCFPILANGFLLCVLNFTD